MTGCRAATPFLYQVRVGYADTDRMGFAHHSRFLVFLESARTELVRAVGDSYLEWEERGVLLPVTAAELQYRSPALYDDILAITVRLLELSRVRLRFAYEVRCPARDVLLATAETRHVFMDRTTLKPLRVAEEFLSPLRSVLEPNGAMDEKTHSG